MHQIYKPSSIYFKVVFKDVIVIVTDQRTSLGQKNLMSQFPAICSKNFASDTSPSSTFCSQKDCHPDNEHRLIKVMD